LQVNAAAFLYVWEIDPLYGKPAGNGTHGNWMMALPDDFLLGLHMFEKHRNLQKEIL